MQAEDIVTFARQLLKEVTPGQYWEDSTLILFADRAQKYVVRQLRWPEGRFSFNSVANVQEYQIPEVIRVLRVYMNGQPIVQTNIPTLEGQQIQLNDQTGTGGGPGGLVAPNEAPVLTSGNYTPQWTGQPAASYPVMSSLSAPSPSAQPWINGQRPRYYLRGGSIGFVPPPLGIYPIVIDCIPQPYQLVNLADACVLPDIALDALAWKVCEFCYYADPTNQQSGDSRNYAAAMFKDAMNEVKAWRKTYDGIGPRGPRILSQRSFYTSGQNTIGATH